MRKQIALFLIKKIQLITFLFLEINLSTTIGNLKATLFKTKIFNIYQFGLNFYFEILNSYQNSESTLEKKVF